MVDQGAVSESHWAAYAAECANKQGKFWEYHDKLFGEWRGEGVGSFTKPNLKKYAADIGHDTATFNKCVDNNETVSVVDAEYAQAQSMGVSGTPTFLINGRALQVRTLDASEFSRTFDSLLK